jgi:protein involved in polysaccharide export with SLBB domain
MNRVTWAFVVVLAFSATGSATGADVPEGTPAGSAPAQAAVSVPEGGAPSALRGPVDQDLYIVGPGDRFAITLWGQTVISLSQVVTPEGDIVLPGVAVVPAAGRSLRDVKAEVSSALGRVYRNVDVNVALVGLREIQVSVLGEVARPGAYVGTALDLASELIRRAGGLVEGASERNIVITRREGEKRRVDLVQYRNAGDLSANPPILDGDVIFVPHAREFIYVFGSIALPGRYEFVPGETIDSAIEIAGGTTRGAVADTVEVRSFMGGATLTFPRVVVRSTGGGAEALSDGDQIFVAQRREWRPVRLVTVDGEVRHPGVYGINEGVDRVGDLIARAGGFTDEASMREARLVRTPAERAPDAEYDRLKEVPISDMSESEYAYFKTRSRGTGDVVAIDFVELSRGDESQNVLLRGGDRLWVPKQKWTVTVDGQVRRPGKYPYVNGRGYARYIREAGGYAANPDRSKTKVIRAATGQWLVARRAGSLEPGDTVWVPEAREADWWTTVKDVASFAASIATAYLLISQATK